MFLGPDGTLPCIHCREDICLGLSRSSQADTIFSSYHKSFLLGDSVDKAVDWAANINHSLARVSRHSADTEIWMVF